MSTKVQGPQKPTKSGGMDLRVGCDPEARSQWKSIVGKINAPARFCNNLPSVPFDPKFLNRPLSSLRKHVMFSSSTLDQAYKIPVLTEPDLGVCPNLVDPDAYKLSNAHKPELSPADLELIEQAAARGMAPKQYRAKSHFAWMRKQEYMANEAYQPNPIAQYKSRTETMASYSSRLLEQDEDGDKSTEEKARDIEATFDVPNLADLKRKDKPGLTAVKMTPILPSSSDIWATLYTQLQFDESPWEAYGQTEELGLTAMIKPFKKALPGFRERRAQAAYESLLGYMVPDSSEEPDEQGQLHQICRNYSFTNEPPEKIFVFTEVDDEHMGYNLVEAKLTVHNHHDKSYCTDRIKLKRRKFKRNELEPRRKRQHMMLTEKEAAQIQEQDEELYRQEQQEEEELENQRLLEQAAMDEEPEDVEGNGEDQPDELAEEEPAAEEPVAAEEPAAEEEPAEEAVEPHSDAPREPNEEVEMKTEEKKTEDSDE